MRRRLLLAGILAAALAAGGGALAGRDATSYRFEVLAQADPSGAGYSGDVVLHRRHAYLSSHRGEKSCPAEGSNRPFTHR